MARIVPARALRWLGDELYFSQRKMVSIVPDGKYPGMWRVRKWDGTLTDMVNRTRAKDAAVSIALGLLNGPEIWATGDGE
jgi:hypothetical protein